MASDENSTRLHHSLTSELLRGDACVSFEGARLQNRQEYLERRLDAKLDETNFRIDLLSKQSVRSNGEEIELRSLLMTRDQIRRQMALDSMSSSAAAPLGAVVQAHGEAAANSKQHLSQDLVLDEAGVLVPRSSLTPAALVTPLPTCGKRAADQGDADGRQHRHRRHHLRHHRPDRHSVRHGRRDSPDHDGSPAPPLPHAACAPAAVGDEDGAAHSVPAAAEHGDGVPLADAVAVTSYAPFRGVALDSLPPTTASLLSNAAAFIRAHVAAGMSAEDVASALRKGEPVRARPKRGEDPRERIARQRATLPIAASRDVFVRQVAAYDVVIVVGETGSGKTTQLPQYLYETVGAAGTWGDEAPVSDAQPRDHPAPRRIACTQPRRVAATSVARRVAEEVGCPVGGPVGYTVRFETATSMDTVVHFMTDGMLLRMLQTSPSLDDYCAVMVDEAHERTVASDIALALLRIVCLARRTKWDAWRRVARAARDGGPPAGDPPLPPLKVVIASATLQTDTFVRFFSFSMEEQAGHLPRSTGGITVDPADGGGTVPPVLTVSGRCYPVEILHATAPCANIVLGAVSTALAIHTSEGPGDVLIFLTGQDDILQAADLLEAAQTEAASGTAPGAFGDLMVVPVFGALPADMQRRIFMTTPAGTRKVVIATNIAETSLTVDGIVYVIDCGISKLNTYDAISNVERLVPTVISQASADQRAGRAGRTAPGKVFRLYTAWCRDNEMPPSTPPELCRCNVAGVVLDLLALGVSDVTTLRMLEDIPAAALTAARRDLRAVGLTSADGAVTALGRKVSGLPVDPLLGRALVAAAHASCMREMVLVVAVLSAGVALTWQPPGRRDAFQTAMRQFRRESGDHASYVEMFRAWDAAGRSSQWAQERFLQQRALERVADIARQLEGVAAGLGLPMSSATDPDALLRALLSGFVFHLASRTAAGDVSGMRGRGRARGPRGAARGRGDREPTFATLRGNRGVDIHPASFLVARMSSDTGGPGKVPPLPRLVVFHELVSSSNTPGSREFMRVASAVTAEWVLEAVPGVYTVAQLGGRGGGAV